MNKNKRKSCILMKYETKNYKFIKDAANVRHSGLYRAEHEIASFGIPSLTF